MKFITTLTALFIFSFASAQELAKNEVDEFTGSIQKFSKTYIIAKGVKGVGKVKAYVGHIDDSYALFVHSTADLGCAGSSGYIIFLFEDKSQYKIDDDVANIDCSDFASSIFIIDPTEFVGKTLSKIRFSQGDSYDDFVANSNTAEFKMSQLIDVVQ